MSVALAKRRLLAIGLTLGVGAVVGYGCFPRQHESIFDGVQVRGNKEFIQQVEASLTLLRDKSPDAFALTRQYVKRIRQSRRSGMRAYANPPTFDLGNKTAHHSVTWCAGSIAHDAFHSKLYHEYREANGEPVPDDAWCGQARELECNNFQLGVLKDIGAPEYEVSYLSGLDGTHFDVDGDGEETWKDRWKQDW
jgi:hypothetical protein